MRFQFDDDQLALRDAVRRFCAARADLAGVGARENAPADGAVWQGLAELGVFGLLIPDESGDGWPVEAAIVFEELGRHLVSGPTIWSVIAAAYVDGCAEGEVRVAGVDTALASGAPLVVEHAAEADVIVLLGADGVALTERDDWTGGETGGPLDPLTPVTTYSAAPAGRAVGDAEVAHRLRLQGALLASASLVGAAQGALDVAGSYALEREQFGVPIGTFQAVKHLLADMYVRVELARAETYAAAAIMARPSTGDVERSVRAAKLLAGEAGLANGRTAVQVLGGMGFTWDMLPHYYLKRSWVLDHAFGTGESHAERLGSSVGDEVASR